MVPSKTNFNPWKNLTEIQKDKALNSTVLIKRCETKLDEIDQFEFYVNKEQILESLTQQQIDKILNGEIVNLDDNLSIISLKTESNVGIDEDTGIIEISPFDKLNEDEKEKILNANVQVPGYIVKFGEFIKNEKNSCKYLSRDEINKMLNGEIVIFFKDLVESLDNFTKRKRAPID